MSASEQELHDWLDHVDAGRGVLLQYFDALRHEFGADLSQIRAMKLSAPGDAGIVGSIDKSFWERCGVKQMGHKLMLAKGIHALEDGGDK